MVLVVGYSTNVISSSLSKTQYQSYFHHGSCGGDAVPYNPVCTACPHGVKETVEHLILRCARRAASGRKYIGRVGDKTVEELCREKPLEVVRFLNSEKLLESNLKR